MVTVRFLLSSVFYLLQFLCAGIINISSSEDASMYAGRLRKKNVCCIYNNARALYPAVLLYTLPTVAIHVRHALLMSA